MHMLCYHFREESEEGGEVSHALMTEIHTVRILCNSLCSEAMTWPSSRSESEDSLRVVEHPILQILHTTLGCCHSRPPGESNTWAQLKCLIFTFLVNSKFSYCTCKSTYVRTRSVSSIVEQGGYR